jgi:hypothetical protein
MFMIRSHFCAAMTTADDERAGDVGLGCRCGAPLIPTTSRMTDEPFSLRRRATAQDGSHVAAMRLAA